MNRMSRFQNPLAIALLFAATLAISNGSLRAQDPKTAPAPPTNITARDHSLDHGTTIDVMWTLSADDIPLTDEQTKNNKDLPAEDQVVKPVSHYKVMRSAEEIGVYEQIGRAEPDKWDYEAGEITFSVEKCRRNEDYFFKVIAVGSDEQESTTVGPIGPTKATRQLFDGTPLDSRKDSRFWMLMVTIVLCGAVIFWIQRARKGKPIKVRKIAGLEAVDEAVGRATEMGRSVLFIPGIQDMNDIQTIAGLTVLSHVAKIAAEYDAKVEVPTSRALVMTTARETVQASFLAAGRPDAYNEDAIYYVTDEQFGYVAYLQGMMVREKPAACFYMGAFFAESLILAETGNSVGAIQVAGTAMPAQLPFFVAACDYTLIGEEFFAASAYLSGEPEQLGSLKGQDVGKIVVALGLIVGVFVSTIAAITPSDVGTIEWLAQFIKDVVMT